jgi:hypothetical protein
VSGLEGYDFSSSMYFTCTLTQLLDDYECAELRMLVEQQCSLDARLMLESILGKPDA